MELKARLGIDFAKGINAMEHVAAFMLLVACSAGDQNCREIPVPVPAYEDVAECGRELRLQLRLHETSPDTVYGACKEVDEEVFERSATLDWSITKDGRLDIRFDAEPQVVASR